MGDSTDPKKPKRPNTRGPHSTRKKSPGPRASTTGGPGPRRVDFSNWREDVRNAKRIKLCDDQKIRFLDHFAENGRMTHAAQAAGVGYNTIKNHLEKDPEFEDAFLQAKRAYRDRVAETAYRIAVEGYEEPIVGGKEKDQIVAYKQVYATNILAMELRRVDPDYKERTEVDMNVKGGVLVAPGTTDPNDWVKEHGKPPADGEVEE